MGFDGHLGEGQAEAAADPALGIPKLAEFFKDALLVFRRRPELRVGISRE